MADWTVQHKHKKRKTQRPAHLVRDQMAHQLECDLKINRLADTILSEEAVTLQCGGWKFSHVSVEDTYDGRSTDTRLVQRREGTSAMSLLHDDRYTILHVHNDYNDVVVFERVEQ